MFSRPLPAPPTMPGEGYWGNNYLDPLSDHASPYYPFRPNRSFGISPTAPFSDQPTTLRGGTVLHKGFYDLLALIPSTPSPSRFLWPARTPQDPEPVAGPRYEEIPSSPPRSPPVQAPSSPQPPLRKARRISKDMVSNPTGFVCVLSNFCGSPLTKFSLTAISYMLPMRIRLTHSSHGGVRMARANLVVRFIIFAVEHCPHPSP